MYIYVHRYLYTCLYIHTCPVNQSSCILRLYYWGFSRIRYYTATRVCCITSGSLVLHCLANKRRLCKVARWVGPTLWWRVVVITSHGENTATVTRSRLPLSPLAPRAGYGCDLEWTRELWPGWRWILNIEEYTGLDANFKLSRETNTTAKVKFQN